ncbi:MAG TPA: hypothetical protein VN671_12925, partial [Solirubrobacterales bacterium]|nr:hypothetical protein [Solirubrobacterales bacterium]
DGVDLYPDGYVRQYYDDKPTFEEGLLQIVEAGTVMTDNATLVRGEEIWPGVKPPPLELIRDESRGGGTTGGGVTYSSNPAVPVPAGPLPVTSMPTHRTVLPKYTCKKGFHRVAKGGASRCVKIKKKPKKHRPTNHHAKKAAHR